MWILDRIVKNKSSTEAKSGEITNSDGKNISAAGTEEYSSLPMISPYGIVSFPPKGEKTVVLSYDFGKVCLGVLSYPQDLEEGEILLCSRGGAQIKLCNNGKVLINGKEV